VRDLVAFVGIASFASACVLALSGVDADRGRQIQRNQLLILQDDAASPAAHQLARATYCLEQSTLLDNEQTPLDAGPGEACYPEAGRP
jgi:hypothetical protein